MTDRYAVIGNPIAHSLSPKIHTLFAEQTGQDMVYDKVEAAPDQFTQTIQQLRNTGVRGVNVTLPFKLQAKIIADKITARVQIARAANTLTFQDKNTIFADNTDGLGLVADLQRRGYPLANRKLLIIGAGGACRGIVLPLLHTGINTLTIANRTLSRAQEIAQAVGDDKIGVCGLDQIAAQTFDCIINATSASLQQQIPDLPAAITTNLEWGYDLVYANDTTVFVTWLQQHGVTNACDGFGMLVYQAAESFYLWRKVKPDAAAVIATLRK